MTQLPAATLRTCTGHLSPAFCISSRHRETGLRPAFMFSPSPFGRLLWPLLRSAAPSRRLSAPVAHALRGERAARQTSQGKTRDFHAIHLSHLRPQPPETLAEMHWALETGASSPEYGRLICASCSSGRHFALGFLQIPDRSGHPCRQLAVPTPRARRGLPPPSHRPDTIPAKRASRHSAPCLAHSRNAVLAEARPAYPG